jgi:hypothetical protein
MGLYEDLQVSVKDYLDFSKGSTGQANAQLNKASQIAKSSADIYDQIGNLQAVAEVAKQTGELKVQEANLKAASALGVDPEAKGGVIIQQLQGLRESQKTTEENLLGLQKIENTEFLKDPVGYIKGNLIDKPRVEKDLAQSVARLELYKGQVQTTQQALQQAVNANIGLKQTFTAESIAANADILKLASRLQSNQAELQAIQYNVEGIKLARSAASEELNAKYHGVNAENAQKHLDLAVADARRKEQEWSVRSVLLNDQLAERELKLQEGQLFADKVNKGRELSGEKPLTKGEIEEAKRVFGTEAGARFQVYYKLGDSVLNGKTEGRFGYTPAGAIDTFSKLPIQLGEEAEATKGVLARAKQKLESLSAEKRAALKVTTSKEDAENRAQWLNKEVQADILKQSEVVTPDASNLRYLGALNDYLVKPEFARYPVVAKVLKPLMDQGVTLTDMNHVMDLQVAAIKTGTLTSTEAAQFAQVIQRADQIKRASRQFDAMGIKVPNTYNVTVQLPLGFQGRRSREGNPVIVNGAKVVNLANPADYQEALAKKLAVNSKF